MISKRSNIYTLPLILLAAFVFTAFSQHPDAGTTVFPFLNMSYDARSVAMGGAAVAMPNDIYGVLSNPAAIGYVQRQQIMGGYRQVMLGVWGGPVGISLPTSLWDNIVFAPHVLTLTSGAFDVVDEFGTETGQRAASTYTALGVSAAKKLKHNVSAGVTIRGLYHYIGVGDESYSAEGLALDIGAQYRTNNNRQIYGIAIRNIGFMRGYWNDWNEYPMPYGIEMGVSHSPRHIPNLRLALDVNKFDGDYMNFEPAFEYTVFKDILYLRGGYNFSTMDFGKALEVFRGERDETYKKSSINSISLGVGVAAVMDNVGMKFDTAIQFYSDITSPAVVISLLVAF
ncbi:MAG: PorV/PorQ family protein [Chitinispirillales bacterium]|jgi:hypothetical protein|nr:PorV/PorQ family protein [Chitinispirillales bacterium]